MATKTAVDLSQSPVTPELLNDPNVITRTFHMSIPSASAMDRASEHSKNVTSTNPEAWKSRTRFEPGSHDKYEMHSETRKGNPANIRAVGNWLKAKSSLPYPVRIRFEGAECLRGNNYDGNTQVAAIVPAHGEISHLLTNPRSPYTKMSQQFPDYNAENLLKIGCMRETGSDVYYVRQDHPALVALKSHALYKEDWPKIQDQLKSAGSNGDQRLEISSGLFEKACETIKEGYFKPFERSTGLNPEKMSVKIERLGGVDWDSTANVASENHLKSAGNVEIDLTSSYIFAK